MEKKSYVLQSLIIGMAIVISSIGAVYLLTSYFGAGRSTIAATGSAEIDFESDLIVWRGNFKASAETSKDAYDKIKIDANKAKRFLLNNGVDEKEMIFDSVNIQEKNEAIYDENGNWRGTKFIGYELSQNVTLTSSDIDKVEKVSRDISQLIEEGVEFTSYSPEYYSTTLSDKKLELIKMATANAKERIDIMANEANAIVGKLKSSKLGVFQIVAKNSGTSSYAYDGYLDTSSRLKTASITVKLEYSIK